MRGELAPSDHHHRGHGIASIHLHNTHALRGATEYRNTAKFSTNNLALARNRDYLFVFFTSNMGRDQITGFAGNLGGQYPLATASLNFISRNVGTLP